MTRVVVVLAVAVMWTLWLSDAAPRHSAFGGISFLAR
jgi:hypothetical protein